MNNFEVFLYYVCFAAIGGAAFAMMWSNIQSINIEMNKPPKPKHPEAPEAGEELSDGQKKVFTDFGIGTNYANSEFFNGFSTAKLE